MSFNNFLSYLQQLLTMVDSDNEYSVALACNALSATINLARISGKADSVTLRTMMMAEQQFTYLAEHREEFAGVPHEYEQNERRRRRLGLMLRPGC